MKQELTIAFCLLAAGVTTGGWWSAGQFGNAWFESERQAEAVVAEPDSSPVTPYAVDSQVQQASYVAAVTPVLASSVDLGAPQPVSDFRSDGSTSDRADLMLRRARHMIEDGPAFESDVAVRATFFGQTVVGSGQYLQAGQGEGKTRTSLAFHAVSADPITGQLVTPPQHKVTNLCDGRFVFRLQEDLVENEQTLEFYDLQQIKNSKKKKKRLSDQRPSIPLAPGELMASGMAGLLQHLADEFRFAIVEEQSAAGTKTRVLRGTWLPSRLQSLLQNHLSPDQQDAGLAWSQLPPNLPHAVEVTLARTSAWELFPSQLKFYQFKTRDDLTLAQPVVVIQFQHPKTVGAVSDDQFVLQSENLEATDLTQQYLSKLRPSDDSTIR